MWCLHGQIGNNATYQPWQLLYSDRSRWPDNPDPGKWGSVYGEHDHPFTLLLSSSEEILVKFIDYIWEYLRMIDYTLSKCGPRASPPSRNLPSFCLSSTNYTHQIFMRRWHAHIWRHQRRGLSSKITCRDLFMYHTFISSKIFISGRVGYPSFD